jgi:hypothetical protein
MDLMDSKEKLREHLKEVKKRMDAVKKLPEYDEYMELKKDFDEFKKFMNDKRVDKTYKFILNEVMGKTPIIKKEDETLVWLERIKKLERRLSDSKWKKGYTFCSSNIMDHVWEVFSKYGDETDVDSYFGTEAYRIGDYIMETYHGQGEYGYAIYTYNRIF